MTSILTVTPNPAIDISTSTEHVAPIRKLRCTTVRRDAGGGGINVARVVRRLGSDVTAVYPAGGATGQLLRRLSRAKASGVLQSTLRRKRARMSRSSKSATPRQDGYARLLLPLWGNGRIEMMLGAISSG